MPERPKVGVGVVVIKDGNVLLGKRKNAHGDGSWCFPGGHLEFGEAIEDCARREVREEAGIEIANPRLGPYTNDIFPDEGKHYITLYVISDYASGDVQILEPDKIEQWQWFEWGSMPQPLFIPIQNLVKQGFHVAS